MFTAFLVRFSALQIKELIIVVKTPSYDENTRGDDRLVMWLCIKMRLVLVNFL